MQAPLLVPFDSFVSFRGPSYIWTWVVDLAPLCQLSVQLHSHSVLRADNQWKIRENVHRILGPSEIVDFTNAKTKSNFVFVDMLCSRYEHWARPNRSVPKATDLKIGVVRKCRTKCNIAAKKVKSGKYSDTKFLLGRSNVEMTQFIVLLMIASSVLRTMCTCWTDSAGRLPLRHTAHVLKSFQCDKSLWSRLQCCRSAVVRLQIAHAGIEWRQSSGTTTKMGINEKWRENERGGGGE